MFCFTYISDVFKQKANNIILNNNYFRQGGNVF